MRVCRRELLAVPLALLALLLAVTSLSARIPYGSGGSSSVPPPTGQQMAFLVYAPSYGQNLGINTTGGAGSANRVIMIVNPTMWPPLPRYSAGGFALSGPNASLFHIDASTGLLSIGAADVAAGTYAVTVSAGGQSQSISITVQPAGSIWFALDHWNLTAGDTVTITVNNAPNACTPPSGGDSINFDYAERNSSFGTASQNMTCGTHTGNFTFTLPDDGADEMKYVVATQFEQNVGGNQSPPILLLPAHPKRAPPIAPNTFTQPFTPAHTVTVCQSGCNFTDWAAAVESTLTQDNVKIEIGQGIYTTCIPTSLTNESNLPKHLWLQGRGGDFPVLGWSGCQNKATITWGYGNAEGDGSQITVDNLRIMNVICDNQAGLRPDGPGNWLIRNVIVNQSCMGLLSGDFGNNITILNSQFERDGGGSGPSHNIYVGNGLGTSTLTITDSITQQANLGYELKTRAHDNIINCSMFLGDIDTSNPHSSDIDFANGRQSHLTNNLFYEGNAVQSQSFAYFMLWGGDQEGETPQTNNWIVATNNYFVEDYSINSSVRNVWSIRNNDPAPSPSPPYVFGPNSYAWTGLVTGTAIAQYNVTDGSLTPGTDVLQPTRAAAGMPNVTYPMPPGCAGHTIGNVAVPP